MYRVVSMLAVEYDRATLTTLATESLAKAAVSSFGGQPLQEATQELLDHCQSLSWLEHVGACVNH